MPLSSKPDSNLLVTSATTAISLLAVVGTWKLAGRLLKNYLHARYTAVNYLRDVGKARPDNERIRGTAVICGGSIAGLYAARVCADHFEDVLIVEPEAWLATEDGYAPVYDANGEKVETTSNLHRTRLHQLYGAHVYNFLTLSTARLLFPDFDEEVRKRGGRIGEFDMNVYTCFGGPCFNSPRPAYPKGDVPVTFYCSRDAYERLLRYVVVKSSNRIRRMAGTAMGLKTDETDFKKIKSVTVMPSDHSASIDVPAALVVDCTGGVQGGFKWLRKLHNLGTEDAQTAIFDELVDTYNINTRWTTCDVYIPEGIRDKLPIPGGYGTGRWLYTFAPIPGIEHKNFFFTVLEGHIMRMSFYGWGDPPMPTCAEEIKTLISSVNAAESAKPPQWVYDMLDILLENEENMTMHPASSPPTMNWIHYEKANFVPKNFVAIGDAVMRVNPALGQGCTKAVVGALTLDARLRSLAHKREIPNGFGSKFFKIHRDKIIDPWGLTKPFDYMFDTTTPVKGEKLSDEKLNGVVTVLLTEMILTDPEVDAVLTLVRHFYAPATDVYAPWILWRLAKFAVKRKMGWI